MCGIAGVLDFERPISSDLLDRMTDVLRHRGPDGRGTYLSGPVALGHRRLAIIDLASGDQPILSDDGERAIVFNGEIYNYRTVRADLEEQGCTFRTRSDTEVILRAYEALGPACVERLRGMFALAIWDGPNQRLFLARDRVGIKPLYYSWDGRRLRFGSEIKAILEDPDADRTIDPRALDDYLTYLYVPAPRSIFASIRKLRPAHTLIVSREGIRESRYWDLSLKPSDPRSEGDIAGGLRDALRDSVECHLMTEVPLGAFLSGGIDSSAVVATMAGLLDQPTTTASIGFRASGFNELPYARRVAELFRTDAHERIVDASAASILDSLVWHFDEPFADSSMVPTYYVSQVAREWVKVCLSGDGGDENFAGYRRYRFDALENQVRSVLPSAVRRPVFGMLGRVYPKADWLPRPFRARTLFQNLALSPEEGYAHTMSWFDRPMKQALYLEPLRRALDGYDPFSVFSEHFERSRGFDPLSRVQYVDMQTYLVDDILTKVDRASMAHSLEVRVPLLDHEFMEYAAGIPADLKLRGGSGKYILKRALEGILPGEILHRPKMGFSLPLAGWFRTDLRPVFEQRVLAKDAFLNDLFEPEPIRRWWALHQRGVRDYSAYLWALLVLECWGGRFLKGSRWGIGQG